MAKKESTIISMVLTLFVVTLIASASLGMVYEKTKEPIAKAKMEKKTNAISNVVPEFDNNPIAEATSKFADGDSLRFYPARKGDELVGIAIETFSNNGFGGKIKLMAGILPDGTISKIVVLEHKETPGLGDKMDKSKSDFPDQFEGKHPDKFKIKVTKDGGDVDAITASTISSRAYCDAVSRAYNTFKEGGIQ